MKIFDYLKQTAKKYPDKTAFVDKQRTINFATLRDEVYHIAYAIAINKIFKKPVAVYLDKSVECIAAFLGATHSGNFYTPLDTKMPKARLEKIISTLSPEIIITDTNHKAEALDIAGSATVIEYEAAQSLQVDENVIKDVCSRVIDTDVLYVLFTSGSTGDPKGVIISHRGLTDFAEWAVKALDIDDSIVFGNQAPLYFSFSIYDIYLPILSGATTYIIPQEKFKFPAVLMEYLNANKINTLCWVPSALSMVSTLHALASPHVDSLRNVYFGGEVMPMKQLNRWRAEYPGVRFFNLYGPTEVTDTCMLYEVNRSFKNTENLPIGVACENKEIILLNENDELASDEEMGEICVRGSGIAYGYYNNPQKTAEVFVQNPLNKTYPETIYRTGDLAQKNEYGEMVYVGRKDFQIKHMGQRIELGEIEAAASSLEQVDSVCCIYNSEKSRIVMFYKGNIDGDTLIEELKKLLPAYMLPGRRIHLDEMPINLNGKIDRYTLKGMDK